MQLHSLHCMLSSLSDATSGRESLRSKQQLRKEESLALLMDGLGLDSPLKLSSSSFSEFARLLSLGSEFASVLRLRDSMDGRGKGEKDGGALMVVCLTGQ